MDVKEKMFMDLVFFMVKFVRNINMYLHLISCLDTEMEQGVKTFPHEKQTHV